MNYQLITDNDRLLEFIDWLPELSEDETYYLCLFARSKYCKGIAHVRSDKAQLKRFTSNKSRMMEKILQLECPIGAYTFREVGSKDNILAVPQEALALYITPNPRSFKKAAVNGLKKLADLITQPYNGWHPHQEVMSEVQKAKSRSELVIFDFDVESKETFLTTIIPTLIKQVNNEALSVVETRGGFHVLVKTKAIAPELVKTWYNGMRSILAIYSSDHDNAGDLMIPVPGTYQGGFTPKFIHRS